MPLPEADRARLIELRRRLDRRRAVLTAALLVVFVLPGTVAVTLAAMRPDPEGAAWFWAGLAWLQCLPAALLCGPLGCAAWVSLTWGAPAKRRTAGTP